MQPDESIGYLIAKTHKRLKKRIMEILVQYDLTTQQYSLLRRLYGNEGMRTGEIAEKLSSDNATIVSIIDRLEEKGLVIRAEDPKDRRVNFIYLTDKARKFLPELISKADIQNNALISTLSEKEVLMFKKIISRINNFQDK